MKQIIRIPAPKVVLAAVLLASALFAFTPAMADNVDLLLAQINIFITEVDLQLALYRTTESDSTLFPFEVAHNILAPAMYDSLSFYASLMSPSDRAIANSKIAKSGFLEMANAYPTVSVALGSKKKAKQAAGIEAKLKKLAKEAIGDDLPKPVQVAIEILCNILNIAKKHKKKK